MDGENNGKPYFLMGDLGGKPLFLETPIYLDFPWDFCFMIDTRWRNSMCIC